MSSLFSEFTLKNIKIKNRIIFPAMLVCDISVPGGYVTEEYLKHYRWLVERGVGMIVAGASCVSPDGMMHPSQLAIWSDDYIEGLSQIPKLCHEKGVPVLMLINHAGHNSCSSTDLISSSGYERNNKTSRALTLEEIKKYQKDYIDAAIRVQKAGFDGVEVQCAHSYLIDSFLSGVRNKRTDQYGGSPQNRARFATEIIKEIKKITGETFIISCRMPYNAPQTEDAIEIAKALEEAGADILEISWGTTLDATIGKGPKAPKDFKYGDMPYGAYMIKKNVSVPVAAVWQIKSEQANEIIENGYADFVGVLRGILVDPKWVDNAKERKSSNKCYNCQPMCKWYYDRTKCPVWDELDEKDRLNKAK